MPDPGHTAGRGPGYPRTRTATTVFGFGQIHLRAGAGVGRAGIQQNTGRGTIPDSLSSAGPHPAINPPAVAPFAPPSSDSLREDTEFEGPARALCECRCRPKSPGLLRLGFTNPRPGPPLELRAGAAAAFGPQIPHASVNGLPATPTATL